MSAFLIHPTSAFGSELVEKMAWAQVLLESDGTRTALILMVAATATLAATMGLAALCDIADQWSKTRPLRLATWTGLLLAGLWTLHGGSGGT